MYESFYGLARKPFQLNPDPGFYFDSAQHHRAMAFVRYGLHQGEGFIVVTGEVGAGKTTLVRNLLGSLDGKGIAAANLVSTQLGADDLLRMVAAAFGVRTQGLSKAEVLLGLEALLTAFTRQGKRCLLIVDEAQNLTTGAVEELRMLSNFQLGSHALLQSFLIGQPEFRLVLQRPELTQLRQRVLAACHIGPLDLQDTRRYIEHRLRLAGWKGNPQIPAEVFAAIHVVSEGIPRRINLVCDRVLLAAYLAESGLLTVDMVGQVSGEINYETSAPSPQGNESEGFASAENLAPLQQLRREDLAPMRHQAAALRVVDAAPPSQSMTQMEEEIRSLKESLLLVERGNRATLGLVRQVLEGRAGAEKGDPAEGPGKP